jgi:predicted Co/Zn/Cd cation transporter (cation efflux family)
MAAKSFARGADYPGQVKEFVIYTLSRLGLFVASYAVVVGIYLLVTGGHSVPLLWPFLVAVVMSAIGSLYLLKGQRARFAAVVERRASAATRRYEQVRSRGDDEED